MRSSSIQNLITFFCSKTWRNCDTNTQLLSLKIWRVAQFTNTCFNETLKWARSRTSVDRTWLLPVICITCHKKWVQLKRLARILSFVLVSGICPPVVQISCLVMFLQTFLYLDNSNPILVFSFFFSSKVYRRHSPYTLCPCIFPVFLRL